MVGCFVVGPTQSGRLRATTALRQCGQYIRGRHGAKRLLVKTAYEPEAGVVQLFFYNDGQPMSAEEGERALRQGLGEEGRGFGLADARYIIETLNGGCLRLAPSDREDFSVLFIVDLKIATPHLQ